MRWTSVLCVAGFLSAMPCLASDVVVTTTADVVNGNTGSPALLAGNPGPDGVSLREAVFATAAVPGPHRILFASAIASTPIALTGPLILMGSNVTIEGPAIIDLHGITGAIAVRGSSITLRRVRVSGIGFGGGGLRIVADGAATPIQDIVVEDCELIGEPDRPNPVGIPIGTGSGGPSGAHFARIRIARNRFEGFGGDGDAVLIGCSTEGCLVEDVMIEGNSFTTTTFPVELAFGAGAHACRTQRTTIRGNTFHDNAQSISIGALGSGTIGADSCVIDATSIEDNSFIANIGGININTGSAASNCVTSHTTVRHNVFRGPQHFALAMGTSGDGPGSTHDNTNSDTVVDGNFISGISEGAALSMNGGFGALAMDNRIVNARLTNNVIIGCGVAVSVFGGSGTGNRVDAAIVNNTIANNSSTGIIVAPTPELLLSVAVVNNIIWNNIPNLSAEQNSTQLAFNLFTDPLFADPSKDNYSLREGSPAIDAGTSDGAPAADMLGQPRCGRVDIGAIERCAGLRRRAVAR